jgi:hypothetical protein
MEEEKQIAIRETELNKKGIQLTTFSQLIEFSHIIVKSGLAPKSFKDKNAVMIAIQFGLEVGLAPMQALQGVAVINGMPSLYGDSAKALCLADPSCVWIKEGMDGSIKEGNLTAWCLSLRQGHDEPLRTEFSMEDAKLANLWGKEGTWKKYPKRMLMFRARGFNLRDNFTDVMKGFKTAEEVRDYEPVGTVNIHRKKPPTGQQLRDNLPPTDDVTFEEVD